MGFKQIFNRMAQLFNIKKAENPGLTFKRMKNAL